MIWTLRQKCIGIERRSLNNVEDLKKVEDPKGLCVLRVQREDSQITGKVSQRLGCGPHRQCNKDEQDGLSCSEDDLKAKKRVSQTR